MRIVIIGANGLLGKELKTMFEQMGHDVVPLYRHHFKRNIHEFKDFFNEADVLINLVGAPMLRRWKKKYRAKLINSRIETATKVITAFKLLRYRPQLYIAASSIGIYDNQQENHTEQSLAFENDFLGTLIGKWEESNQRFTKLHNVRVVIMRMAFVLTKKGGMLRKIARPFKYGFGGRTGKGDQAFSFIHIDDFKKAILFFIENINTSGVYNLVAPKQSSNKQFSKYLGKALKIPSFFIKPKRFVKLRYGKASKLILDVPSTIPQKLNKAGFSFDYPDVESAIDNLISRK